MRHRHPRLRHFLACALPAALMVGLMFLSDWVLQPMHGRGVAQTPLGMLNGLSRLLEMPGNFLVWGVVARLPYSRALISRNWELFACLNFLFYALIFAFLYGLNSRLNHWAARQPLPAPAERSETQPAARGPSRRRLLLGVRSAVIGGAALAGGYPLLVEPRRLEVTRRSFPIRDLPPMLDGLRLVQLTDIHLGPWNSLACVRRIVDAANALDADLILLTGDYVLHSPEYIAPAASALAGLRAKLGVVGVLGNHDWREDGPLSKRALTRSGVRLIDNDRLFVTPSRRLTDAPQEGLCLAGVGDLWTDRQLYGRALGNLPADMPRLLLSHNPDVAEEPPFVTSGHRVDLMLSGHTHGGQIYLPGAGALVTMSRYGQKYLRGLVQGPTCPVYISRGLGTAMLPLRFGSVPEVAVIELRCANC